MFRSQLDRFKNCYELEIFHEEGKLLVTSIDLKETIILQEGLPDIHFTIDGPAKLGRIDIFNAHLANVRCLLNGLEQLWKVTIRHSYIMLSGNLIQNCNNLVELNVINNRCYQPPEFGYGNLTNLHDNTFFNIGFLLRLDINYNNIYTVDKRAFYGLVNLKTLNLEYNEISELPRTLFSYMPTLRHLYIGYNNFEEILYEYIENSHNLVKLDIKGTNISYIEPKSFEYHDKLRALDLSKNYIDYCDTHVFMGLTSLVYLNLFNNVIIAFPKDLFTFTPSLITLNLGNNRIYEINENTFLKLNFLQELYLSSNNIIFLKPGMFVGLENLAKLDIHSNQIEVLSVDTFMGLEKLKWLDLSNNCIFKCHDETFNHLCKLKYLFLQNNKLTQLSNRLFFQLKKLTHLNLSNNKIATVAVNVFKNLIDLEDFSFINNIYKLSDIHVEHLTKLKYIHLTTSQKYLLYDKCIYNFSNLVNIHFILEELTYIDLEYFNFFSLLETLILRRLRITPFHKETYRSLYLEQHKSRDYLIDCRLCDFIHMPISTKFPQIQNGFKKMVHLRILNLSNSLINYIPEDALRNLENLQELNLNFNAIRYLPKNVFSSLHSLRILLLSWNEIEDLNDIFYNLKNLTHLDLSFNKLNRVKKHMFVFSENLLFLSFKSNCLKQILPEYDFDVTTWKSSVRYLDYAGNFITSTNRKIMQHFPKLLRLNLSYNNIKCIEGICDYNCLPIIHVGTYSNFIIYPHMIRDNYPYRLL